MSGGLRMLALACVGAMAGVGVALMVLAAPGRLTWPAGRPTGATSPRRHRTGGGNSAAGRWGALPGEAGPIGAAAGAGLVAGVLVGMPVLAVLTGGLVWLAREARGLRAVPAVNELGEAVATWCETVRQELDAGQPLRAAVAASCQLPPPPLTTPLTALAHRLDAQQPLPAALAAFHRETAHPAVGQVVAALTLAYRHGAGELGRLMASQVEATRHRVAVVRDLHAGRARHRRAMTLLLALFALTTAALLAAWPALLAPYRGPLGQLVLTTDLLFVGTAVHALLRRSRPPTVPDFFRRAR
ncbi:hypothetical protein I6A84_17325 [Frankia sp. CNm7]|uniref:Type II secretion system protein GspF domain-containing protein n=1 Tax=Frankia nepalensis TaxID=1836974 RepID=A0A937RC60_9ACTN|nr:hypothetical protein [Frankia nepalensis]MBL7498771.1 hypothetical protein [Frankia nepalensis]MBL7508365.1 hypothetical protein [Frankia nepalensis]MBL7519812.1 hypothetical protein [Frankia nepalensis]MBL7626194.1 hypothetical protein [Frankia nepalensis]